MENNIKKIYRHVYDTDKDDEGIEKPNEFLGEFEIIEGDNNGYNYEMIGIKDGKKYRIFGQEIVFYGDSYNAGTKNFVELIEE